MHYLTTEFYTLKLKDVTSDFRNVAVFVAIKLYNTLHTTFSARILIWLHAKFHVLDLQWVTNGIKLMTSYILQTDYLNKGEHILFEIYCQTASKEPTLSGVQTAPISEVRASAMLLLASVGN
jgi:hypothetical protein